LLALVSTAAVLLRFRTASLGDIQLRLASLEAALSDESWCAAACAPTGFWGSTQAVAPTDRRGSPGLDCDSISSCPGSPCLWISNA
jgi:hypothetical protein